MGSLTREGSEVDELDKKLEYALQVGEDELDKALDLVLEDGEENYEDDEEGDREGERDGNEEEGPEQGPEAGPLLSMEGDDGAGVGFFQHSGSLAYEALAEKKRRALADYKGEGSTTKAGLEDASKAALEDLEATFGSSRRRKSRKRRKNGRHKGSKNKLSPEISKMLADGTLHYVHRRYEQGLAVLKEVLRLAPNLPDAYHTLGLIYDKLGDSQKARGFYTLAALTKPKDPSFWEVLFTWHREQGDLARAVMCLSRAVRADPSNIYLRSRLTDLYLELGDYRKAAETHEQILKICPDDLRVLMTSVELYSMCGQMERSVSILQCYLKDHPSEADFCVINILADILMQTRNHDSALKHIEHAQQVYYLGKELPLPLRIKAGICHAHLGDIDRAKSFFCSLEKENASSSSELITEVADAFTSLGHFHSALKYYHMLDLNGEHDNEGRILFKIAQCHLSLSNRVEAVEYFYRALPKLSDSVDARLALTTLLLEDSKEDEAITLLSPPENPSEVNFNPENPKEWYSDVKIQLKLSQIYRSKGMHEAFVNILLPLVRDSLHGKTFPQKAKKRLTTSMLRKRVKILEVGGTNDVLDGVRPLASRSDRLKATRARRLLKEKEERKAAARASGIDWNSDISDDDESAEVREPPPLPNLLENEEHQNLIIDLCKALQSLQRYWEALEIISLTKKLASSNKLPSEKQQELQSLAAQISYYTTDPKHSLDCVKSVVQQRPYSFAAWNCFYKITSRLEKTFPRKFLRYMRAKHKDCVPPIVISGHQFTAGSHYQDASREYLEAYKLLPENPLVNLCAGTALINLALGFRLQNKHQCVAQGLAFLHNNLRLTGGKSQEALYNIARGYQQVGMSTLAVSYYEKVLSMSEKDDPIPKFPNEENPEEVNDDTATAGGYCDLRREAAYNLHFIYLKSGAVDLARQVLRDHCIL